MMEQATMYEMLLYHSINRFNIDAHQGEDISGDYLALHADAYRVLYDVETDEPHPLWQRHLDKKDALFTAWEQEGTLYDDDLERRWLYYLKGIIVAILGKHGKLDKAPIATGGDGEDFL